MLNEQVRKAQHEKDITVHDKDIAIAATEKLRTKKDKLKVELK